MDASAPATFGRGAAYFAYNIPSVAFVGGLVRVVIAIYHLVKKYWHTDAPSSIKGTSFIERMERKVDDLLTSSSSNSPSVKKAAWLNMLYRGLIEMIPIAGPAFFTYVDNKGKSYRFYNDQQISIFGLDEMKQLLEDSWND